jgi:hypothetical protein
MPVIPTLERLLLTLWVGGLWVTGLVLAPTLFRHFERQLAGEIAGRLFTAMSLVGLACGAALLGLAVVRTKRDLWRDWRVGALLVMLLVTLAGEFGLGARMRELKELATQAGSASALWAEFGRLHGVASVLFLLNCVLGLVLVVFGVRPQTQVGS